MTQESLVQTQLVKLGDELSEKALQGQVSGAILITIDSAAQANISWAGVDSFTALGLLQTMAAKVMNINLGNYR